MKLSSTAFSPDGPIPVDFTGDGRDLSPELSWINVPDGVLEFALICDDPDAPTNEPWVHWVLYKIPTEWRILPEGLGSHAEMNLPHGLRQGRNSWPDGEITCYRGPLPPRGHGVHHYHFRLYALDEPVDLHPGATKEELLKAMAGHVIAGSEVIGTYFR